MTIDEIYMQRAIQLAKSAAGLTYPNPMVGAVIVCDGKIIGEGFHFKAGMGHAEVNAVNNVKNKELLKKSTIYVSLEPCAHYGKTPPCAKLIIDMQIPRIVVGCVDSFSKVSGKGIEMLRNAGREVIVGVLEKECRELNRRFFTLHEKNRPYVILKWAQSADGYIDIKRTKEQKAASITSSNLTCALMVHKQRTEEQAILIGANTMRMDNPQLTARKWDGNNPVRIVITNSNNLDENAKMLTDGQPTIVINTVRNQENGNIRYIKTESITAENILNILGQLQLQSVIVEGGTQTLQTFIDSNLYDEAFIYQSAENLYDGVRAPQIDCCNATIENIGKVTLKHIIKTKQ